MRELAHAVLNEVSGRIDLDYSSSAYWHGAWSDDTRPMTYLDGSVGHDVLVGEDRVNHMPSRGGGTGYFNPAGLDGGDMVQKCWAIFCGDHTSGLLSSGVWTGFSVEHFASLQNVEVAQSATVTRLRMHPLSGDVTTIVPSRRARYLQHPLALIALTKKKQARRKRNSKLGMKEWKGFQRQLDKLAARADDSPIAGDAPPHASYMSILWSFAHAVRRRQMKALRSFLAAQAKIEGSLFERVAIVGRSIT